MLHAGATEEAEEYVLGGEFRIEQFYNAVLIRNASEYVWKGSTDFERELYPQLRIVDFHPQTGTGQFAAVRIQPGVDPLEMWFYEKQHGPLRMDLDYCGYLDALLLTMGTFGWQYLYIDVPLADRAFTGVVGYLRKMFEVLPAVFPEHDYAPLGERLERRL